MVPFNFPWSKTTSSWGRTPWRFLLHHNLFWCCNQIGKNYFNFDITLYKLRIASWLFYLCTLLQLNSTGALIWIFCIGTSTQTNFELELLAFETWVLKLYHEIFWLLLGLWGWFTIHLKDMNLRIEMSGETFPTVFWFKNYSKNSRVLTVLWDTLYFSLHEYDDLMMFDSFLDP